MMSGPSVTLPALSASSGSRPRRRGEMPVCGLGEAAITAARIMVGDKRMDHHSFFMMAAPVRRLVCPVSQPRPVDIAQRAAFDPVENQGAVLGQLFCPLPD